MSTWIIYLVVIQLMPLLVLIRPGNIIIRDFQIMMVLQIAALSGFYLIWGGYSIDAWRYLSRFTHDPFGFEEEWLFWIIGNSLNKILTDPWPLKLLSVGGVLLFALAVVRWFKPSQMKERIIALALFPLLPVFFLSLGNTIRQGLASIIIVHGIVWLIRARWIGFALMGLVGILFHEVAILFVIGALAFRLPARIIYIFLAFAPFVSYSAYFLLDLLGINLDQIIRYSYYHEGDYHFLKFALSYGLSIFLLVIRNIRSLPDKTNYLIKIYAIMVGISSIFLMYEVPFERMLQYGEFLLPLIIPSVLITVFWSKIIIALVWIGILSMGLVLWTNRSIMDTLGV
jgi:hypothetical protein